jgi:hypothetical protein
MINDNNAVLRSNNSLVIKKVPIIISNPKVIDTERSSTTLFPKRLINELNNSISRGGCERNSVE